MNVNSLACSHLWSFIIVPATYLFWVYSIFAWLSAISRCYFFSSISYNSEVSHLEFENSHREMCNCIKKMQMYCLDPENQHSHIQTPVWIKASEVFSTHGISWPRRPPTVTSKSIAKAYAIICLLPLFFGRHSSATGQRLRKLFIWQWSCRSLLWSSWISSKSTILQFSWPPDAMTLLPVSKIHENEHGGRSMSCAIALYLQKITDFHGYFDWLYCFLCDLLLDIWGHFKCKDLFPLYGLWNE